MTYHFVGPHCKQVGHEGRETRSETALSNETQLEFGEAYGVIASFPVPAGNVKEIRLQATHTHKTSHVTLMTRKSTDVRA